MEAHVGPKKEGLSAHVLQTTWGHYVTVRNFFPLSFKARYQPISKRIKKKHIVHPTAIGKGGLLCETKLRRLHLNLNICFCLPPEREPCHPNPCHNAGKCLSTSEGFVCRCSTGYRGETCTGTIIRELSLTQPREPIKDLFSWLTLS